MAARGRPTGYKPEYAAQAEKLCALGATDIELADFFEVSVRTIERWRVTHDEFCRAVKTAKEVANERVERRLFERAMGYSHEAVKIVTVAGEVQQVPFIEHYPPDTTAAIFWLKNRKPAEWRDKVDHEMTGKNGGAIEIVAVTDKARARAMLLLASKAKQAVD